MNKESSNNEEETSPFDLVMEKVGYFGSFQKKFSYIYNIAFIIFMGMSSNIIFLLAIPDHWCNVPGKNLTNFSLEEWKNLTIPKEMNVKGKESASKCKMYNITGVDFSGLNADSSLEHLEIIDCQYGWEFDQTWFIETIPSAGEWVCEKELYVTNIFSITRIAAVVGSFTFGQLGDIIGRKPVFFIAFITFLMSRIGLILSANDYVTFLVIMCLGNLFSAALIQSPLIISMEICNEKKKSKIAMLQPVSFTIAFSLTAFVFWIYRHWLYVSITTTIPCFLFLFTLKYLIESPRWLADKGKYKKCVNILEKIAKENGTKVPEDAITTLQQMSKKQQETSYGMMSLFSNRRLALYTLLILVGAIKDALLIDILVLNITNLAGNVFFNFFLNGIFEMPAFFMARWFCDKYGRRWAQVVPSFISGFAGIILILLINDESMAYVVSPLSSFIKFLSALMYLGANLQCMELYPSTVRQSLLSLWSIVSSIVSVGVPYIIYLGTAYDSRYPIMVITFISFFGGICVSLLPETLNEKLPETLAEASVFGVDQKFWSMPKKSRTKQYNNKII